MALWFNYEKVGKGVPKPDPEKPRTSVYFELLLRKMWDMCKTNLLYMLLLIPTFVLTMLVSGVVISPITDSLATVFARDLEGIQLGTMLVTFDVAARALLSVWFMVFLGMGPATAGMTYIVRNFGREEHAWLWSDMWRNIKVNFKQSIALWILDLAVFFVVVVALRFYSRIDGVGKIASYILFVVSFMYLMMHVYVYQMLVTFELPFKYILKNSVILALMTAPRTILMLIIAAAIHIGIPYLLFVTGSMGLPMIIFVLLEILLLPTATAFTTNFFIYPEIEKLIKQAQADETEN